MEYIANLQNLKKDLNVKKDKRVFKHSINKRATLLPFTTNQNERAKFEQGFRGVIGEFSRILCGNILSKEVDFEVTIDRIINKVNIEEEDKPYLRKLISSFLVNDNSSIKVFHPHMFQYFSLSNAKEAKSEREIALFLRDVLVKDYSKFKTFFYKDNIENIITRLILQEIDFIEYKSIGKKYFGKLNFISDLFKEDVDFLLNYKEYLMDNIENLLTYYYFFYITQLTLKLNRKEKEDFNKVEEVYYLLDWESASKNRTSIIKGYKFIKEKTRNLLVNINCIEHLNFILGVKGATYQELREEFNFKSERDKEQILQVIREWIKEYREIQNLEKINIIECDYDNLVEILFKSLDKGITNSTKSRYPLYIEAIGKKYFLKTRGVYGYMLNITQEFLLFITAICIKKDKITLKELFKEYEKRGIFFDRYSKEAIVELLNKLNLIHKKSDSGDAQYVKSIL